MDTDVLEQLYKPRFDNHKFRNKQEELCFASRQNQDINKEQERHSTLTMTKFYFILLVPFHLLLL